MEQRCVILFVAILLVVLSSVVVWLVDKTRIEKDYYPDSQIIRRIYKKKKGVKNGIEKVFYRSGILNKKKNWTLGTLDGKSETYFPNGKVNIRCYYKEGKLEGKWIAYNIDGSVLESHEYVNGEIVG
jgi:antitoxin component YwqK of YwqJK toxin-antitoxin module